MQDREDNPTGYMLFSDRMGKVYSTCTYDCALTRVLPGPDTPKIGFQGLREILLSQDLSLNGKLSEISADDFLFLDGNEDMTGNMTALLSYPRSGNSFIRNYVMRASGLYTGSDIPSILLQNSGFLGDNTVNDTNLVWITKSHFPIMMRMVKPKFKSQKTFIVVRNPIDVFFS